MGRYNFDFKKLMDHGIVFITQAHDLSTGERIKPVIEPSTQKEWDESTNLITLYNIKNPVKGEQDYIYLALRHPRPDQAPTWTENQETISDGKYQQILWGINHKNMRPEEFTTERVDDEIRRINDIVTGSDAYKMMPTTPIDSQLHNPSLY